MAIDLNYEPDYRNYYATLVRAQKIILVPSLTLESGITLGSVPVAYKSWGNLNEDRDNVLVLCHALTGSSDVEDWWRPLMGPGKAFDPRRYFIFCGNVLGSPYGSVSPVSANPVTGRPYGPKFPETTIRDDVNAHKLVLDALGVRGVAAVIGGSMGGMTTLEWPLCTPLGYVKNIIPITTSAYHGAWGISWGETQRRCIYSDASFRNGWYEPTPNRQPSKGLGTARMIAMLTYRSHGSFESRFSRRPSTKKENPAPAAEIANLPTPPPSHRGSVDLEVESIDDTPPPITFAAQSYMQYQAEKFLARFDANCYIHLTSKMDSHDVTRGRLNTPRGQEPAFPPTRENLKSVLSNVPPKALVISVETDVLFRPEQQSELAECLPDAKLVALDSQDGHDGFLLEFEKLNELIITHLSQQCPWIYKKDVGMLDGSIEPHEVTDSVFGEAEAVVF